MFRPCCNICWRRSPLCSRASWFSVRKKNDWSQSPKKYFKKKQALWGCFVCAHTCMYMFESACVVYVHTCRDQRSTSDAFLCYCTLCSETLTKKSSVAGRWAQGSFCHYLPGAGVINLWLHIQVSHMSSENGTSCLQVHPRKATSWVPTDSSDQPIMELREIAGGWILPNLCQVPGISWQLWPSYCVN